LSNVYIILNTDKDQDYKMKYLSYKDAVLLFNAELDKKLKSYTYPSVKEFSRIFNIDYKCLIAMRKNTDGRKYPLVLKQGLNGLGFDVDREERFAINKKKP